MAKAKESAKAKEEILKEVSGPAEETPAEKEVDTAQNEMTVDENVEETVIESELSTDNDGDAEETEKTDAANTAEYVDYCLPFLPGKEPGDSQTVTINGKNYQVQYGVPVKVPVGVKEVLDDMIAQQRRTREKIERLTKEEKCIAVFE